MVGFLPTLESLPVACAFDADSAAGMAVHFDYTFFSLTFFVFSGFRQALSNSHQFLHTLYRFLRDFFCDSSLARFFLLRDNKKGFFSLKKSCVRNGCVGKEISLALL